MSKRVQLLGHIAEIAAGFLGLERELTVDTDNAELRLHDGVTEGGRRFLDRDANDNRYQARSVELDGLLGWEPQERGMLARLGPSDYRLRSLTVNVSNLTISNANGFGGNPYVSLKETISTDHSFTGEIQFTQAIDAAGGVAGDLVGDSIGTHTGPVVGDVTGNLTGDSTGTHTGNLDTSGGGVLMGDGQILGAWLEDAIFDFIVNAGLPVGCCVPYDGDIEDLPANWKVCDGTDGTPDLRDRFVIAAGDTYSADATGGGLTHVHGITIESSGAHTHIGTVGDTTLTVAQIPNHKHANGVTDSGTNVFSRGTTAAAMTTTASIDNNANDGTIEGWSESVGGGNPHSHSLALDSAGIHSHTGSSAAAGNLPPYYALVYIKKVA
jgi:microcystin-dependent protein